jgi:hypothetical protein
VDVARLDEEVRGLLAHFETASDEELAELKQQIKSIESLRAQYRANLDFFGKRLSARVDPTQDTEQASPSEGPMFESRRALPSHQECAGLRGSSKAT